MDKSVFIHPKALVETEFIKRNTRVWAFAHILKGARIGENCNIGDHAFIEEKVVIGNNVTIKNGISLWDGITIEDNVFLGPNVVFTNDLYPRSKVYLDVYVPTLIKEGASLGANSTILAGVTIGRWAMIGAGSVVTKNAPDFTLLYGSPAKWHGYICRCAQKLKFKNKTASCRCGQKYKLKNKNVFKC
ncbi:MAG: acyltransferase [Planctomycetota bacterium]